MKELLYVFVGGGLGSMIRLLASQKLNPIYTNLGTFIVNILGALLLGFLVCLFHKKIISNYGYVLLAIGFCGGLTTFSTFAFEGINWIEQKQYIQFFQYIFGTLIIGITFCAVGYWLGNIFTEAKG